MAQVNRVGVTGRVGGLSGSDWEGGCAECGWLPPRLPFLPSLSPSNYPMQHCVNSPNLPEESLEYALKELPLHRADQPSGTGRSLAAQFVLN